VKDIAAAELYSCFPSAIQSFGLDLGLEGTCPLTVTGTMAFSGGPFNNFSLEGVAKMVEVLRSGDPGEPSERRVGLVSNLSGIFGKQACALFSNVPNDAGYGYEDMTAAVAAEDLPVPLDGDYTGPASIIGYTVVFKKVEPSHAIAICDTPAGKRTVVRTEDRTLMSQMMEQEFCGRAIEVDQDGGFSLVE
jgi:acetyl-CoA C-acetyltransferase